jgi:UDP-N-acetylmuramate dehydrogenase
MSFTIHTDHPIGSLTTFGFPITASAYAEVFSVDEAQSLVRSETWKNTPILWLGGGSNMLFTENYTGLVVRNRLYGVEVVHKDEENVWIRSKGGENWHQLVMFCVENGYAGLENLALIPGTVGAAPMQNIGAYGVEIKDVFDSLEAVSLATGDVHTFSKSDCQFGYRDSIFKQAAKGQYFITSVTFRLSLHPTPNTSYGAIRRVLTERGISAPNIRDVAEAVMHIRRSKLPDPAVLGNAGSFFKNPEIPEAQFQALIAHYPAMPSYPVGHGLVKVPAGWLIEQAGWKGKRVGNVGVHAHQALVLVHYGGGQGQEIVQLSRQVQADVQTKFGILLHPEVNFIGAV